MCLCLFRILEAHSGCIKIDNIDISKLGLNFLRENLTVIPQEPTLIEGTLRDNVDPSNTYNDKQITDALIEVGLGSLVKEHTIEYEILENGKNLSIGEKQLVCIARAMLRKSKIILMDEATSSIDYKTEKIIQNTINKVLEGSTVITIAHRINTIINYDKILVLANGEVAEFDTPENLLKNKKGLFSELYKESAI
jgi:ATP-binding cassette subfamily C (CFTR/MRP) protein 1